MTSGLDSPLSSDSVAATLKAIRRSLTEPAGRDERLRTVVKVLSESRPHYSWTGIYLLQADVLVLHNQIGLPTPHERIPIGQGICGLAARERRLRLRLEAGDVSESGRPHPVDPGPSPSQDAIRKEGLRDLFHAGGGVRTEHLELAVYESLIGLARELGHDQAAELLEQNREDEERALKLLQQLAGKLRGALAEV